MSASTPFCDSTSSTSAIKLPTSRNSATPKPRVVQAGEPSRIPEVTAGFSGSNGMPFLLQVMWARPSAASATLPVRRFGPQIDQHQMVVGAAGDDLAAARFAAFRPAPWRSSTTACGIDAELGLQRLAERHGLGGDDVHQRAALQAREHRRVDLLRQVRVVGRIMPPRGPRSVLCVVVVTTCGVRQRARMHAAGHQPGEMRHVHHEIGADFVGDRAEAGEIDEARIGRAAGDDQLGPVLAGRAAASSS